MRQIPSPVSKIPLELLTEIFRHVVSPSLQEDFLSPSMPDFRQYPSTSYRSCASPLSLSHVCGTWRVLSLALPSLWTNLRVQNPRNPQIVFLIFTWVQRARKRNLSLSLRQNSDGGEDKLQVEATRQVWKLFLDLLERCLYLEVDVNIGFESLSKGVIKLAKRSTPLTLEAIKVSFGRGVDNDGKDIESPQMQSPKSKEWDESVFLAHLLYCSHRLRTIVWDNNHVHIQLGLVSPLWHMLTGLTLYASQDIPSLLHALSKCTLLHQLTICEQTPSSHHSTTHQNLDATSSHIIVPDLHTLTLGTFAHPELLFSHLVTPSLRNLIILHGQHGKKGWRGFSKAAWFALSEMLRRSAGAKLALLKIGGVEVQGAIDEPQWKELQYGDVKI